MARNLSLLPHLLMIFILSFSLSNAQHQTTKPTTLFLIGIDGMSVDGFTTAHTPNMDKLKVNGASSLKARGVMPTKSGPNWGSMLLGAGPEQHGITSNDWRVDNYTIAPTIQDEDGYFPSIFDVLRKAHPTEKLAVFHEWETINKLFNNKAVDVVVKTEEMNETLNKAFDYFVEHKPLFVFIHLDAIDHAGHEFGHGTKEYYHEIEVLDKALGTFFKKLEDYNKKEDIAASILITSDHGGVGKEHGGSTMAEIEIPWLLVAPGVAQGKTITQPINTYDTPATIAWLLGAEQNIPIQWTGKPVKTVMKD